MMMLGSFGRRLVLFNEADTLGLGWVWTVGVRGLLSIAESAGVAV
jgi:hypothetical protein